MKILIDWDFDYLSQNQSISIKDVIENINED